MVAAGQRGVERVTTTIDLNFLELVGPTGRRLMSGHLRGDANDRARFGALAEAALAGELDPVLKAEPNPAFVHVSTSCHTLALALMNRHNGMVSSEFYKGDPSGYVRVNLLVQRLLGIERLTVGCPVYAFSAEALGQAMLYPDVQAPGSDPGDPLLSLDQREEIPEFDSAGEIARVVRETLQTTARLTGIEPVAHLAAPYSLAAEILGQEALINGLLSQPDKVEAFLATLVERVLAPWCADLFEQVPHVWLELSDASASPMFIGPANFLAIAVDPVRRLIEEYPWGNRIFVANYRGDSPPDRAGGGSRRRRQKPVDHGLSFETLIEAKIACCPHFLIRLEADNAGTDAYVAAAVQHAVPLYLGLGAVRLDKNSVVDRVAAAEELRNDALQRARSIHEVRSAVGLEGTELEDHSWPGDLYIEDVNGETDLDLLGSVLDGCRASNRRVG